ncbi:Uncharacterized protein TCM_013579 [Theobroma cacao]|uniref:Uncharacterized protein n=1 Tax=Theobroma cacao TaxID=3641 RepID=A0A061FX41_THECC|nr:Uncharacterized protein TCM_013579 [Theobroma cacao]
MYVSKQLVEAQITHCTKVIDGGSSHPYAEVTGEVNAVNSVTSEVFIENHPKYPLKASLVANFKRDDDELLEYVNMLDASSWILRA